MAAYQWDLDRIYPSFDSEAFRNDFASLEKDAEELKALLAEAGEKPDRAFVKKLLEKLEETEKRLRKTGVYVHLRTAVNAGDGEAMGVSLRLSRLVAKLSPLYSGADRVLAAGDFYEEAAKTDPFFADYRFLLEKTRRSAVHLLSDEAEEMYAAMNVFAGSQWQKLNGSLTSLVTAEYEGRQITLSEARALAHSDSAAVRKAAYETELACCRQIEVPAAFSLNAIKQQTAMIARKRGFASALEMTLDDQNMTAQTLDAMLGQLREYLPQFRRYLKAKATLLGHGNGLPWYDVFASVGTSVRKFTPEEAGEYLVRTFSSFSDEMAGMMRRAFSERWIDFFPGKGKRGGAFCSGVESIGESRILANFDGSFSTVDTLAHELGHAYHNLVLAKHRPLNRSGYPMALAETASNFNETFLLNHALKNASAEERLALLDSYLAKANQIMCDIYSRYLFETAVFENCEKEFLSPETLCGLMLNAQREAYGDALDPEFPHPYMWVAKNHYYSTTRSFYNFPYAFGGLLSNGLYAMYEKEPETFTEKYRRFLRETTVNTIEGAAASIGIDVTKPAFWKAGLETYKTFIDRFCALASAQ